MNTLLAPTFERLGMTLRPDRQLETDRLGVLNPASARLRDGSLELYPRMVAPGNISRIGDFHTRESGRTITCEQRGFALEPSEPYEIRTEPGGYGCEDPRVTFIAAIDKYVMAYVAFGAPGPEIAVAVSDDGRAWERLGPLRFEGTKPMADKDAAFFPEPVRSPQGVESFAFYHRPTLQLSIRDGEDALAYIQKLPQEEREGIAIGFIPFAAVRKDLRNFCCCTETYRLKLPQAEWGVIKVGAGTPPVRVREGWMSVIHGVDILEHPKGSARLRYSGGVIVHDAEHIENVIYRSPQPLLVPEKPAELHGAVGHVVFPTAIDPRGERVFDIYYGMADYEIGRGRLTLGDT
ncbi:MAG: glycosidase [Candidatus Eremiobacteraeota bacterium]|nr:glycosidase [Candidatus Eremiobacteraeota bacterium]